MPDSRNVSAEYFAGVSSRTDGVSSRFTEATKSAQTLAAKVKDLGFAQQQVLVLLDFAPDLLRKSCDAVIFGHNRSRSHSTLMLRRGPIDSAK